MLSRCGSAAVDIDVFCADREARKRSKAEAAAKKQREEEQRAAEEAVRKAEEEARAAENAAEAKKNRQLERKATQKERGRLRTTCINPRTSLCKAGFQHFLPRRHL